MILDHDFVYSIGKHILSGTVVRSEENRRWTVFWDDIAKCCVHPSAILRFEHRAEEHPLRGMNVASIIVNQSVANQDGCDRCNRNVFSGGDES